MNKPEESVLNELEQDKDIILISISEDRQTVHMTSDNWQKMEAILAKCSMKVDFKICIKNPPVMVVRNTEEQTITVPLNAWQAVQNALKRTGHKVDTFKVDNVSKGLQ